MRFRRSSRRRHTDPLRTCPSCCSGLACPTAWEPSDDAHWHIDLRCGECEHRWETIVEDRRAARYDVELDDDLATMNRTATTEAGEVFGFLVPNGAGTTTTIRTLLGLLRPTAGSAHPRRRRDARRSESPLARRLHPPRSPSSSGLPASPVSSGMGTGCRSCC